MTYFLIFVMVASVLGAVFDFQRGEIQRYKGVKYTQGDTSISAKIDGKPYQFRYFPAQLERVHLDPAVGNALRSTEMVVISYNASSPLTEALAGIQYNVQETLQVSLDAYIQPAIVSNNSYNLPVMDCQNATQFIPIIVLHQTNETGLWYQNNCIDARFESEADLSVLRDQLLYASLGVLP